MLFGEIRQPDSNYLVIPKVSSENREYIPIAKMPKTVVTYAALSVVPNATNYHFGVITSAMHMAWMRAVAGRLESRYRYSNKLVYNNFPWPEKPTATKKERIEKCALAVLDARKEHHGASLADLYNPQTMPKTLRAAHKNLDRAVDRAYRPQPFPDERARLEFLFAEYNKLTAPALPPPPKKRRRQTKKA